MLLYYHGQSFKKSDNLALEKSYSKGFYGGMTFEEPGQRWRLVTELT